MQFSVLERVCKQNLYNIKDRFQYLKDNFILKLAALLVGFLSGNLFGTVLLFVRNFIVWDGFIIAVLLIVFEIASYMAYKVRHFYLLQRFSSIIKAIHFFKVGIMIGFFIDAFKVGS